MASGHVSRTNRPNTWLHRPSLRREVFPCQLGAVDTWHLEPVPLGGGMMVWHGLYATQRAIIETHPAT